MNAPVARFTHQIHGDLDVLMYRGEQRGQKKFNNPDSTHLRDHSHFR